MMKWNNDVLEFSGFDYGVRRGSDIEAEFELDEEQENSVQVIDEEWKEELRQKRKYLDELVQMLRSDKEVMESCKEKDSEVDQRKKDSYLHRLEINSEKERSIENEYFRNIEQAERKLNQILMLKEKWLDETEKQRAQRLRLRPIAHPNPFKDQESSSSRCSIQ